MSLKTALADCWYRRGCAWTYLLAPATGLFILLSALRRLGYRLGLRPIARLPVPVVVVGNIAVGGTGKTPFVIWLVEALRRAGRHPGIVSRGHGGSSLEPVPVDSASDPAACGDEPVLLARRTGCPVWVGRRRGDAAKAMLRAHPEVDVLVCDDGLQHYALARDIEIAVVDGVRGHGNGWRLPVGPLREAPGRLDGVDAVIVNGVSDAAVGFPGSFAMRLVPGEFVNLRHPERRGGSEAFQNGPVHAVAGIGHPQRFFDTLADLGLSVVPHGFPDHHAFTVADLPAGTVIMTEKDAVKCAAFVRDDLWSLGVDAQVDDGLQSLILSKLEKRHGQQIA